MKCKEIINYLEVLSHTSYAYEWDNVGLLVGDDEKVVKRVMIALDATEDIIEKAIEQNVDLLITHHPLIFKPLLNIVASDFVGKRLLKIMEHGICYYAMHTNFDVMGMADAAAEQLGLLQPAVLTKTYEDEISVEGIGRVGNVLLSMPLSEYAEVVKQAFQLEQVLIYGAQETMVDKVAIAPGSGKSMIADAMKHNAQVLITGDMDYHSGIDAVAQGLCIIDAGHYGIEKIFIPYMQAFFEHNIKEIEVIVAPLVNPFFVV